MAARSILLLGLGNPGPGYTHHRHNVGFQCLEAWEPTLAPWHSKKESLWCSGPTSLWPTRPWRMVKPLTYMNASGLVLNIHKYFGGLWVIHDDLDLPFGRVKVKIGGSDGGHRGLESITHHHKTALYGRIRIGIGHPGTAGLVSKYVLSSFPPAQFQALAHLWPLLAQKLALYFPLPLTKAGAVETFSFL